MGFALFGYSWAFSRALSLVRRQIRNPDEPVVDVFTITLPNGRRDQRSIMRVDDPADIHGIAVQVGRKAALLPIIPSDTGFYERLRRRAHASPARRGDFTGPEILWPAEPLHSRDLPRVV